MRKAIGTVFSIIITAIILTASLYLLSSLETINNPAHMASAWGFTPLTVVSGSMSPGIETGDMVIIKNGNSDIKPGDIVTYRLGEVLVTHRVKELSGDASREVFVTQGDANSIPDYRAVSREQIIGKYAFRIPFGGYLMASLRGLPGILIILGLSLIVLMSEVLRITNKKVREVEETLIE